MLMERSSTFLNLEGQNASLGAQVQLRSSASFKAVNLSIELHPIHAQSRPTSSVLSHSVLIDVVVKTPTRHGARPIEALPEPRQLPQISNPLHNRLGSHTYCSDILVTNHLSRYKKKRN
jgi:hypothetical protein